MKATFRWIYEPEGVKSILTMTVQEVKKADVRTSSLQFLSSFDLSRRRTVLLILENDIDLPLYMSTIMTRDFLDLHDALKTFIFEERRVTLSEWPIGLLELSENDQRLSLEAKGMKKTLEPFWRRDVHHFMFFDSYETYQLDEIRDGRLHLSLDKKQHSRGVEKLLSDLFWLALLALVIISLVPLLVLNIFSPSPQLPLDQIFTFPWMGTLYIFGLILLTILAFTWKVDGLVKTLVMNGSHKFLIIDPNASMITKTVKPWRKEPFSQSARLNYFYLTITKRIGPSFSQSSNEWLIQALTPLGLITCSRSTRLEELIYHRVALEQFFEKDADFQSWHFVKKPPILKQAPSLNPSVNGQEWIWSPTILKSEILAGVAYPLVLTLMIFLSAMLVMFFFPFINPLQFNLNLSSLKWLFLVLVFSILIVTIIVSGTWIAFQRWFLFKPRMIFQVNKRQILIQNDVMFDKDILAVVPFSAVKTIKIFETNKRLFIALVIDETSLDEKPKVQSLQEMRILLVMSDKGSHRSEQIHDFLKQHFPTQSPIFIGEEDFFYE